MKSGGHQMSRTPEPGGPRPCEHCEAKVFPFAIRRPGDDAGPSGRYLADDEDGMIVHICKVFKHER